MYGFSQNVSYLFEGFTYPKCKLQLGVVPPKKSRDYTAAKDAKTKSHVNPCVQTCRFRVFAFSRFRVFAFSRFPARSRVFGFSRFRAEVPRITGAETHTHTHFLHSINEGTQNDWFVMENPIETDD